MSILRTTTLGILALTVALIWWGVWYLDTHQHLHVTFFDVGQGDSIFIEDPNGNQILIDGGPTDRILSKLGSHLPFWDHSIDLIILTHPHADHVSGLLEVLKRYDVGLIVESGANYSTAQYEEWERLIRDKKIRTILAERGEHIRFSYNGTLDILAPFESFQDVSLKNVHDSMVVSRLHYGSTTILLMGDAEKPLELELLRTQKNNSFFDLTSDVLKIGHHGSKTSTAEEFLKAVSPSFAIIQAGKENRYGHPTQVVLDRLQAFGVTTFRNDRDGDIIVESDGITIDFARGKP